MRMHSLAFLGLLSFMALIVGAPIAPGQENKSEDMPVVEPRMISDSYVIWYRQDLTDEQFRNQITFLKKEFPAFADQAPYEELQAIRAVIIALPPSGLTRLEELRQEQIRRFEQTKEEIDRPTISSIGGDFEIETFDESLCDEDEVTLPLTTVVTPPGICRVGGGSGEDYSGATVWVIDSGVDNRSGLLNVNSALAANCIPRPCQDTGADRRFLDKLGHGTMVAGIIGAKGVSTGGTKGIYGVAPSAVIIPVKVFGPKGQSRFLGPPLRGFNYVYDKYASGDPVTSNIIINISWGINWTRDLRVNKLDSVLEFHKRLRVLADKGLQIVLAAGNGADDEKPKWVQFITPAAAGNYTGANGGHIYTVSAAISTQDEVNAWNDEWWPNSFYGSGPPDYAEPGADIQSLWLQTGPHNTLKKCSGTSFAAPHLAGILARLGVGVTPMSGMEDQVADDPSLPLDRIGRAGAAASGLCEYAHN